MRRSLNVILSPLFPIALLLSCAVMAGENDHHHAQEAHVHGIAELQLVLEGEQMEVMFHSPAMNLTGFEHQAQSPEQKAKVESVRQHLRDANTLLSLQGGDCSIATQQVDTSAILPTTREQHDARQHKHHDQHQHEHEGHHEDESHKQHSNIESHYRYTCSKPRQLQRLSVELLTIFHGIETLQVQWIVHGRQGAAALNRDNRTITFR